MKRKFKQVLLHFGSDKTGSTSLQYIFDQSRQLLLEKALVAYAPGCQHFWLGSFFCDFPEKYNANIAMGCVDRKAIQKRDQLHIEDLTDWMNQLPQCDTLLFSFEGFPSMDKPAMQKMKDFCCSLADEVKIILYLRPPLSYAVSAMSQKVKTGRKSWASCPMWAYQPNIKKCVDVFGKDKVILKIFSSATLKNQNIVEDFCNLIRLPDEVTAQLPRLHFANQSLTSAGLKLGDLLIDYFKNHSIRKHDLTQEGFFRSYGRSLCYIPGGKIKLSQAQVEEVKRLSKPHCEFLEKEFKIVFHEDFESYEYMTEEQSHAEDKMVAALFSILINFATQVKSQASFGELFKISLQNFGVEKHH